MEECELGKKYTDRISGFKGIAMCRTVYLNGCIRIGLQPEVGKDGKFIDVEYFDEPQLIEHEKKKKTTGGPQSAPRRNPNPK